MRFSRDGAPRRVQVPAPVQRAQVQAQVRASGRVRLRILLFLLPLLLILSLVLFAVPAYPQDTGSAEREFHGRGVEINVAVHDPSGDLLTVPATVKVFRDGSIPSGQGETSRGQIVFVVYLVGDFTVVVKAPGYADAQKDLSVHVAGRAQVDVYLRSNAENGATPPPGRPVLAPKAQEAFDKGLLALSADKLDDAQKYVRKAVELAPSHPDVLYLQGLLFMKQRNWPQAQSALEKSTQIDPAHAPAFAALGMALCDQGKFDVAVAPLEKSLELNESRQAQKSSPADKSPTSNSAEAWQTRWTLARAYYRLEHYDQALQMSQSALTGSQGKAPEIALLVAQSLTAVGRYDDAAQTLRDFLRDHAGQPQASTAQRWLTNLSAAGKLHPN
jgi:thioredoxin-like negative regulator of GroEL